MEWLNEQLMDRAHATKQKFFDVIWMAFSLFQFLIQIKMNRIPMRVDIDGRGEYSFEQTDGHSLYVKNDNEILKLCN